MNNFKNPIVLGLTGVVLTYGYLWYMKNQKVEETKQKLNSAFGQGIITQEQMSQQLEIVKNESINLLYPLIVGMVAWFIRSSMSNTPNSADAVGSTSSKLVGNISDSVSLSMVKPRNSNLWR
jgi:hypothetical protein